MEDSDEVESVMRFRFAILALMVLAACSRALHAQEAGFEVLVYSRTAAFRHDSIPAGIAAIQALGVERDFDVDATEDPAVFTDAGLAPYEVVVFLCTTGDVLDAAQQAAFERFIRAGGGWVGVHSASDTEYDWSFYGGLVGAYFQGHPAIQAADVHVEDPGHPSTAGLPALWQRTDEWYNFQSNPRGQVHVLATLDESSYSGGTMGQDHPITWSHEYEGGRAWYTALGHTSESYSEPLLRSHLAGAIEWAAQAGPATTATPSGTATRIATAAATSTRIVTAAPSGAATSTPVRTATPAPSGAATVTRPATASPGSSSTATLTATGTAAANVTASGTATATVLPAAPGGGNLALLVLLHATAGSTLLRALARRLRASRNSS